MVVPKFGLFINLTGAFACTALAFVLPALIFNKVFEGKISLNQKRFNSFVIVFGTLCGAISFFESLLALIYAFKYDDD